MIKVIFDESKFARLVYNNKEYIWAGYFQEPTGHGEIITAESTDKVSGIWNIELGQDNLFRIHSKISSNNFPDPSYFICFYPGSQGRFINQIIRSLLDDNFAGITECRSGFNSWHRVRSTTLNYVGTHHYPNWTLIRNRDYLNKNKFIIIKFDYADFPEIYGNGIYKNIVQDISVYLEKHKNFDLSRYHEIFQNLYGTCSLENFVKIFATDHDKLQTVIKFELDNYLLNFEDPKCLIDTEFITGTVDPDFEQQTLVINYKDIYTTSSTGYIALDKICDFFKISVTEDAVKCFNLNAIGRENLIKKYLYKLDIR